MIYSWLTTKYEEVLNGKFLEIYCMGPVAITGDPAKINIAPGAILGHPSKELLQELTNTLDENDREKLIAKRPPVVLSEGDIIGPYTVLYEGVELRRNVFLEGRCIIRRCSSLSENTTVYFGAYIGENVSIGNNCKIGGFVCNNAKVENGSAILGALIHEYSRPGIKRKEPSPIIRENVLIGMNSLVIGGVEIGANARISAGAIVLKDVPKSELVIGVYK
jgi:acetyltransferase-like isoleucine patch superfamily enzyme